MGNVVGETTQGEVSPASRPDVFRRIAGSLSNTSLSPNSGTPQWGGGGEKEARGHRPRNGGCFRKKGTTIDKRTNNTVEHKY